MSSSASDKAFVGSIAKVYAASLVPLLFESYATDIAARLARRPVSRVLELAAGTGVVTRALASSLPASTTIVATDLNQPMLDEAAAGDTVRPVEWRQADAQQLPFGDASFDAIVCQFGVMFFPDKTKAFAEARRVLEPGGVYIFSVWDRIEENECADIVTRALATMFPDDPPRFLARVPHGYYDRAVIERDLAAGGFATSEFMTVPARSRADSPRLPAVAFCEGSPLRAEIEARTASGLDAATDRAASAIATRFGDGAIDTKMQAIVVTVQG
jgi:SAM-dependent methyltransferase